MSSSFIPSGLERLWSAWNIRGFMLLSLSMQILLAAASPFRKRTSNPLTTFLVWSAYFLSDWAAIFAVGLITNSGCRSPSSQVHPDVLALWAAFLMMHLGGPDTITAFSLEDNALWLRHLVGLVVQIFAFFYIIAKALPNKHGLLAPTILIFIAGVVKYGERTRALYLASLERMKKSVEDSPESNLMDLNPLVDEGWRCAFKLLELLKGWVVDVMPSRSIWQESREFFQKQDAKAAYVTLTKELSFLYDILYTKTLAVNSYWGVLIRSIAFYNLLIALLLFCLSKKQELQEVDVNITYLLLSGALVLDMASGIMLIMSGWGLTNDRSLGGCQIMAQGCLPVVGILLYGCLLGCCFNHLAKRSWSEGMGAFDLLNYRFKECNDRVKGRKCRVAFGLIVEKIGIAEAAAEVSYVPRIPLTELWELFFDDLLGKASLASDAEKTKVIYEARGNLTLSEHNCDDLMHFVKDLEYGSSLLMWHVATHICLSLEDAENDPMKKWMSETISNYMLYLLVKRPKMMSPIVGLGCVRYRDTSAELKRIGRRIDAGSMEEFCKKILEENDGGTELAEPKLQGRGRSVLMDSCNLAKLLMKKEGKWKIITGVWTEMLSYAACHCKVESHARSLCQGGEFISLVWLLMAHLGIGGPHLPIE